MEQFRFVQRRTSATKTRLEGGPEFIQYSSRLPRSTIFLCIWPIAYIKKTVVFYDCAFSP